MQISRLSLLKGVSVSILAVLFIFFSATSVKAESQIICISDPIPTGWIITDAFQVGQTCGLGTPLPGNYLPNQYEITRYDTYFLNEELSICIGQTIPDGWTSIGESRDLSRCGAQIFPPVSWPPLNNVETIRKTSGPPRTYSPWGFLEGVNVDGQSVFGWAVDPDSPASSIVIHFYIDGYAGAGGTFIGQTVSSIPRPETGYQGNRGFTFRIPSEYYDNAQHTIFAYAIDVVGGNPPSFLTQSPQTFTFGPTSNPIRFDFDGDRKSDVAIFRPSNFEWWYINSSNGQTATTTFGSSGDISIAADFDGDGKSDIGIFRPSSGTWYYINSSNGQVSSKQFGSSGDIPQVADFDGDGKSDIAIYRPSSSDWWYIESSSGQVASTTFGVSGDIAMAADFDGDGKSDIGVFRPSNGTWYYINSSNSQVSYVQFGLSGDIPQVADFDGDGKSDIAIFRPSNADWWYIKSSDGQIFSTTFGISGDIPVSADFDGDAKSEIGVFRPSNGSWSYIKSSNNQAHTIQFGMTGDVPIQKLQ